MKQLISDLKIVYGFSDVNARIAYNRWVSGELSEPQRRAISWLFYNPFRGRNDSIEQTPIGYEKTLTKLNFLISEEIDSDCA